jgi:biotin carboxyl carrier protein
VAPMPGKVIAMSVVVGQTVKRGETLLILEAMKMEHSVLSSSDGVVEEILVDEGQQLEANALLVVVSSAGEVSQC